jgi:predicted 3-demethylubiquinone-9 3-methyltransferase (glyoxalase superfamily)
MSWQIVPSMIDEMMSSRDARVSDRVMNALLKMKKLDIAKLTRAAAQQ